MPFFSFSAITRSFAHTKASISTVLICLLLTACASSDVPPLQSRNIALGFDHMAPIALRVQDVIIENQFVDQTAPPAIGYLMPQPPAAAMAAWAKHRLLATGQGHHILKVTIENAAATETENPTDASVSSWLTVDQAETTKIAYDVTFRMMAIGTGQETARMTISNWKSTTIPDDASINAREWIWFELLEQTIADFNAKFNAAAPEYLGSYMLPAP